MTKALKRPCQGHSQKSPTLVQLFSTQSQHSQADSLAPKATKTGHETQPPPGQPVTTLDAPGLMSPPVPKKLRFSPKPDSSTLAHRSKEKKKLHKMTPAWKSTTSEVIKEQGNAPQTRNPTETTTRRPSTERIPN